MTVRYEILYRPQVHQDLDEIPRNMQVRIKKAIEIRLQTYPYEYGEKLARSLYNLWKIRCGDYRIAYEIQEEEKTVTIWGIQHRGKIYETLLHRWK